MSPVDKAGSVFQEKLQHELACTGPVENQVFRKLIFDVLNINRNTKPGSQQTRSAKTHVAGWRRLI